jgi:hypothetical protein
MIASNAVISFVGVNSVVAVQPSAQDGGQKRLFWFGLAAPGSCEAPGRTQPRCSTCVDRPLERCTACSPGDDVVSGHLARWRALCAMSFMPSRRRR